MRLVERGFALVVGIYLVLLLAVLLLHSREAAAPAVHLNWQVPHFTLKFNLNHPECQLCKWPIEFIPKPRDRISYLVSFPGSGNNWVLNSITSGTRLFPCSVYNETKTSTLFNRCSITKTHYPVFRTRYDSVKSAESLIFILRNPFDAISAEVFRQEPRNWNKMLRKLEKAFPRMALKWKQFAETNLGNRFWERKFKTNFQRTSSHAERREMIVFYEDFKQNQQASLLNLFTFMKHTLQDDMVPTPSEATLCALELDSAAFGHGSIRGRKKQDIFATQRFTNLTRMACEMWTELWVVEKWGPCMDHMNRHYSREVMGIVSVNPYKPIPC